MKNIYTFEVTQSSSSQSVGDIDKPLTFGSFSSQSHWARSGNYSLYVQWGTLEDSYNLSIMRLLQRNI